MLHFVSKRVVTAATAIVVATLAVSTTNASDNKQPQAEILHWWSTEGEFAALSVFINAFEARGGLYYDSSKSDEPTSRKEAVERMGKGYPATLTQWNAGKNLVDMFDFGLIKPIQNPEIVQKLKNTLPIAVLDTVSHRGEIIAIPLNVHSENWLWYSQEHFKPSEINLSGDWAEFIQRGESLAAKNIPLLAVGNQPWQVRILFTSVFLGVSRDHYKDFYLSGDIGVVDTDEFKTTLEIFSQLARYSQSFGDHTWNAQVKAVVENKAAANFMGDWAKSEFTIHGQRAGEDYGCQLTSTSEPSVLMVIDTLVLGKVEEKSELEGQQLMLEVVSDEALNLQFNMLKGSVSPYIQSVAHKPDRCTAQVYAALDNDEALIPPYQSYFPKLGHYAEYVDDAIYELWVASLQTDHDSDKLVEQAQEKFRTLFERKANELSKRAAK